jgi:hypothetical protein
MNVIVNDPNEQYLRNQKRDRKLFIENCKSNMKKELNEMERCVEERDPVAYQISWNLYNKCKREMDIVEGRVKVVGSKRQYLRYLTYKMEFLN